MLEAMLAAPSPVVSNAVCVAYTRSGRTCNEQREMSEIIWDGSRVKQHIVRRQQSCAYLEQRGLFLLQYCRLVFLSLSCSVIQVRDHSSRVRHVLLFGDEETERVVVQPDEEYKSSVCWANTTSIMVQIVFCLHNNATKKDTIHVLG